MVTIGVSLPIPAPYAEVLQRARRSAGDPLAGAVPPHVTLMPPTQIDDGALAALEEHLVGVAAAYDPFRMILQGTGTFRPVSPVVFVAVAEGIGQCERLEQDVRSGPVARELDFIYHPHVTVAHHVADEALDGVFDELATFRCAFRVTGLDLYEHGADQVWRSRRTFPFRV
ncbi:2'-5' RNA ligase family protein [Leekyejoonella antrihumi]|uniref:2'-5' RNA ligase family protein n=2 Tax=Leekyejoonella antrihumi TaxID=1660198 RepID=A0A563DSG3_9MICO|nr:2'-5' RNA ligase family protein [Leekyejoonella antrihumi]TWP32923.1 2'-5' RNA ligase family protein [Leekyejoonella antrihumi]